MKHEPQPPSGEFIERYAVVMVHMLSMVAAVKSHNLHGRPTQDQGREIGEQLRELIDDASARVQGNRRAVAGIGHHDFIRLVSAHLRVLLDELEGLE